MNRYLRPPVTFRRFEAGEFHECDGIGFRIVKGVKSPEDLRLDWWTGSEWRAISSKTVGFMAEFIYENEHVLYPPPLQGGEKFVAYLKHSIQHGTGKAQAGLDVERRNKQRRLNEGEAS